MEEIWKDIPNYEGLYQISNYGNVKSLKRKTTNGKILKKGKSSNGYWNISLSKNNVKKTYNIHRLLMFVFMGKSNLDIDHKNCNKKDCNLSNLEYVTKSENQKRAYKNGLKEKARLASKKNIVKATEKIKKPVIQYDKNNNKIKEWKTIAEASKKLLINDANISSCCKGKRNIAGGYIWKYKEVK